MTLSLVPEKKVLTQRMCILCGKTFFLKYEIFITQHSDIMANYTAFCRLAGSRLG